MELGSGTGLAGLTCALLGGEPTWITDQAFVFLCSATIVDYIDLCSPMLDIMRRNVLLNDLSSKVMVSELNWSALPSWLVSPSYT